MRRAVRIACGLVLLVLAACGKKVNGPVPNPDNRRIAIIGHGGMGNPGINNPYQLNSFNAHKNALDVYRLDGVETDIQLSSDSALFMIHDDFLELLTYCSGCIANADSAFISSCGFRPVSSGQFRADPVTPLSSLLNFVTSRRNRVRVFLDIHPPSTCIPDSGRRSVYFGRLLRSLGRLLQQYPVGDRISIQSGDRELLSQAETALPGIAIYLDYCKSIEDVQYAVSRGYTGVAAETTVFSGELVEAAHKAGLLVQLYDAGSENDIVDALSKWPDFFLADNVVLTQQIAEIVNGN